MRRVAWVVLVLCLWPSGLPGTALAATAPSDLPSGYRIAGNDRYDTSAEVSGRAHPGTETVFVVSGTAYADAVAAGPAAAVNKDGLQLVGSTIHPRLRDSVSRGSVMKAVIVGGTAAVSPAIEQELTGLGATVRRLAGPDRYGTAAAVALDAFPQGASTVLVATGENFPDAIAAGSDGAALGYPVLLTRRFEVPTATAGALQQLRPGRVVVVGQPDVVGDSVVDTLKREGLTVERVGGDDRYATSAALSAKLFAGSVNAILATGVDFPDALSASPLSAAQQAPLLLVPGKCIPSAVGAEMRRLGVASTVTIGGADVVLPAVTAGAPCEGPCPVLGAPLPLAASPDPRLCITTGYDTFGPGNTSSRFTMYLVAENRSGDVIDISHPSSCPIFYGQFDLRGQYMGGGPTACTGGMVTDRLRPRTTRTYTFQVNTGSVDGTYLFAAGLNVGQARAFGLGSIWYARERTENLGSP